MWPARTTSWEGRWPTVRRATSIGTMWRQRLHIRSCIAPFYSISTDVILGPHIGSPQPGGTTLNMEGTHRTWSAPPFVHAVPRFLVVLRDYRPEHLAQDDDDDDGILSLAHTRAQANPAPYDAMRPTLTGGALASHQYTCIILDTHTASALLMSGTADPTPTTVPPHPLPPRSVQDWQLRWCNLGDRAS